MRGADACAAGGQTMPNSRLCQHKTSRVASLLANTHLRASKTRGAAHALHGLRHAALHVAHVASRLLLRGPTHLTCELRRERRSRRANLSGGRANNVSKTATLEAQRHINGGYLQAVLHALKACVRDDRSTRQTRLETNAPEQRSAGGRQRACRHQAQAAYKSEVKKRGKLGAAGFRV